MRSPARIGAASLFLLLLALAGCAGRQRAPKAFPPPAILPSAAALETIVASRREALQSLRAVARLHYRDPSDSSTSREAIVVARPDRLRVEVLTFLGAVFVLTASDGEFTAYARRENTVYRGAASATNLWRYLRIGLPVAHLVDLLLGTPPRMTWTSARVAFEPSTGRIRLRRERDGAALLVWFEQDAVVAVEGRGPDQSVAWRADFGDFETIAGQPVATRIRLALPAERRAIEIDLRDVDINPTLRPEIFTFDPPAGARIVEIDGRVS